MPIDPAAPFATTQEEKTAATLADLRRRLEALEHGHPTIQVGTGAPTSTPRDGAPYVDAAAPRLYLRVAGAWRYTTLT